MDTGKDMVDTKGSVRNLLGVPLEVKVVLEIHQAVGRRVAQVEVVVDRRMVVVVDHRMEVDPRMEVDHLRKDIPQKEDLHLHSLRFQDSHREDQGLEGCLVAGYLVSVGCELNGVHD